MGRDIGAPHYNQRGLASKPPNPVLQSRAQVLYLCAGLPKTLCSGLVGIATPVSRAIIMKVTG